MYSLRFFGGDKISFTKDSGTDYEIVDIADWKLPLFDEPIHPSMGKYQHDHTKAWSEKIKQADGYIFVTPEYNYGPPPSLVNALNYVYLEWNYKPAGFVSYGGVSGGLRSVQVAKSTIGAQPRWSVTADQPTSTGTAPAAPPITMFWLDVRLSRIV